MMEFLTTILGGINSFFSEFWNLFLIWISIFKIPFSNPDLLWIIVPVWFAWFFAEFFQEKRKTSLGNAISNGVVPVWVAIDWTRFLVNNLNAGNIDLELDIIFKFAICALVFLYGIMIIAMGINGDETTRYFGKIRVVTYILLMFTPIVYGAISLNGETIVAIGLFFPIFYYAIEFIDDYLPDPKAIIEDDKPERPAVSAKPSSSSDYNVNNNSAKNNLNNNFR